MMDSAKESVRILFDLLEAHGVKEVICSPGSRNTPLIIAAEARESMIKRVVGDERSAAFVALGAAMIRREPVALVCTSGTAMLNYSPAVAEAYYQGVPLIVISADRPLEWIDQDDSQTIRQPYALQNIVKATYSISDRQQSDIPGWYETRIINDAMLTALQPKQGPVHINVRLAPPLESVTPYKPDEAIRIIRRIGPSPLPEKSMLKQLASAILDKRVMIVVGFMMPDSRLNRGINRIRCHRNVAVMAETLSNLHLPSEDYAVDSALCILSPDERRSLAPDVIISLGGALVSRKLKEYLRECGDRNRELEHWCVGYTHTTTDCFRALTLRIETDPGRFIAALSAEMAHLGRKANAVGNTDFATNWSNVKKRAIERINRISQSAEWSDLTAMRLILDSLPPRANLFLSNGTVVRYAQLFERSLPHGEYCNRGVSGIDGSTSTAIGGAVAYRGETILVTGDSSFAYDLSAIQTLRHVKASMKIIVINNSGGGIFRFISTTSALPCREEYFCADPELPLRAIAEAYGIGYLRADSEESLREALSTFTDASGSMILEVITPPRESAEILKYLLNPKYEYGKQQ